MRHPFTPIGYMVSGAVLGVCILAVLFDVGMISVSGLHRLAFAGANMVLLPIGGAALVVLVIGVPYEIIKRARR